MSPPRRSGDVDRVDAVAERLGEGAALLVERPAGGGDHLVGRVAADADAAEQGGVEPAAVLVAAFGVEVGGEAASSGSTSSTACQLAPDSNQTSRMSISLRKSSTVPQWGRPCRRAGGLRRTSRYQASAPSLLEELDDRCVDGCVVERLVALSQRKTAMGTPQMRWRLMHQSGRVAIMLLMRSLPQAGSHVTS